MKEINFVLSNPTETVSVSGVLLFSDGKPVEDEYVTFLLGKKGEQDDKKYESTDAEGRFKIRVLKGVKGEVFGEFGSRVGEYLKCPKLVDYKS